MSDFDGLIYKYIDTVSREQTNHWKSKPSNIWILVLNKIAANHLKNT